MHPALNWILRLVPAALIGQTLPFKFSGHEQSVALFTDLTEKALGNPGLEAAARIGTGVVELVAVVLLLIPKTALIGALLTIGVMAGALASHVLFIGFAGHGPLPALAAVALASAAIYVVLQRKAV